MTTNDEQYVPDEEDVRTDYALGGARDTIGDIDHRAIPELEAEFDRFLARVRRDAKVEAWDGCYHQMVTAPARGVIVTRKSNPYAPERRETP